MFWVAALVLVAGALWLLGEILLPFVAGMALAYLLNPLTNRLERTGIPRWIGALCVVSLIVLAIVLLLLVIAPVIGVQLAGLIENIPRYIRRLQEFVTDPSRPWLSRLVGERFGDADKAVGEVATRGAALATAALGTVWSGGRTLLSVLSLLVVMPVVAYYFLADWPRIVASVDRLVPRAQQDTIRTLAREADDAVSGFVRGQTTVCLLLGLFYAVALSLVGLNFGLLIGLVAGLISFIPYIGSITGLVLSLGVAIAQFWPDWIWIAAVLAIFFVGQFVEGNILMPKLVGDSAGLHPLWLMFALFAFGYLFGFLGLLLAVPLAAALGVLVRFAIRRYLASPLYKGGKR